MWVTEPNERIRPYQLIANFENEEIYLQLRGLDIAVISYSDFYGCYVSDIKFKSPEGDIMRLLHDKDMDLEVVKLEVVMKAVELGWRDFSKELFMRVP